MTDLFSAYGSQPASADMRQFNYEIMLDQLYKGDLSLFFTNHLVVDSTLWAAPVAQDGIAIIAHPDVDVDSLTLDQLRAIYQGHITSWSELGGTDQPILVFSREEGSGTRSEFERMVMGYRTTTSLAQVAASSELMLHQVARQPGAVGYVSMAFLDSTVTTLALEGVVPTPRSVFQNRYSLRSTIYIVGLSEPGGQERTFIGWAQGSEGQQIVSRLYAPLIDVWDD